MSDRTSALTFTTMVRNLSAIGRGLGLEIPAFRSNPSEGNRTLKRHETGEYVVAIRLDRSPEEVGLDMIDAVVLVNSPEDEGQTRKRLARSIQHLMTPSEGGS